jgi:hypothetical protein
VYYYRKQKYNVANDSTCKNQTTLDPRMSSLSDILRRAYNKIILQPIQEVDTTIARAKKDETYCVATEKEKQYNVPTNASRKT